MLVFHKCLFVWDKVWKHITRFMRVRTGVPVLKMGCLLSACEKVALLAEAWLITVKAS